MHVPLLWHGLIRQGSRPYRRVIMIMSDLSKWLNESKKIWFTFVERKIPCTASTGLEMCSGCPVSWPCETASLTLNPWILWISKEFTIDSMTPMCPNHQSSITGLKSDVFVLICYFWFLANHLYFGLTCHMCVRNTNKFKIKMLLTIIWLPEPHLKKEILNNFHIYLFIYFDR